MTDQIVIYGGEIGLAACCGRRPIREVSTALERKEVRIRIPMTLSGLFSMMFVGVRLFAITVNRYAKGLSQINKPHGWSGKHSPSLLFRPYGLTKAGGQFVHLSR
jgi:hypothetical protein